MKDLWRVDVPEYVGKEWQIKRFEIGPRTVGAFYFAAHGRPIPHGVYTQLLYHGSVMMSDTPAEMYDALGFIYAAKGHVLVSGLGLGCIIKPLSASERVSSITVIEKSAELIDAVAPTYATLPKVRVIEADAFSWKSDRKFDSAWHDIWPDICADNLPEMSKLKRRFKTPLSRCWSEREARRGL